MSIDIEAMMMELKEEPLQLLNRILKRPAIDIEFQNLKYSVRGIKTGWSKILHSINGEFRSGQLTAIMGPSGAGKTTLLNILSGYVTSGIEGIININNYPINRNIFRKMISYIMQEDAIQPSLTVKESIIYAARLKLSNDISYEYKMAVVQEIIKLLGLKNCINTFSQHLSGGERKRLTIALELVNNPPVIFLDEPTTGLDNFTIKQCVHLLKKISRLDRTVVCTIHQPPSSVFEHFDQVYVLGDGNCVYNGSPEQMVSFFTQINHTCPPNHTPAEFMIELVHSQPEIVNTCKEAIQNGKMNMLNPLRKDNKTLEAITIRRTSQILMDKDSSDYNASFCIQFSVILSRMCLQMKRNTLQLYLMVFHSIFCGLAVGTIYFGIGNNAAEIIGILKFCTCISVFYLYTYMLVAALMVPLEMKVIKREYFNRWYNLKAYFLANTVSGLPFVIIFGTLFGAITYFLTDQPREINRFVGFLLICLALGLASQGFGFIIGSLFNITKSAVIASFSFGPLFAFCFAGMDYKVSFGATREFILNTSFMRQGIIGLLNVLFHNRQPLTCSETYCHYVRPDAFMHDIGISAVNYTHQLYLLVILMVIFRVVAYFTLKYRISNEFSSKILHVFDVLRPGKH